ncbi:MAG TPA: SDR family NAD(P)-dependent oxidoreductase, partial [Chitinophaga sp.]|uniref:SDR family NAD(P)-dependent oxidoreductase n=1 Tax=Chitinophaga sp. TaxID=1869181 RepID=UPI002B8A46A9
VQLKDVYWRRKFSGGSARIITRLVPDGEHVRLTVVEQEAVDRERLLFECAAITAPLPVASPLDIPVLLKACVHRMEAAECYRRFSQAGLDYGPAFRTIRDLRYNNYEVLAAIDFPDAGKEEQQPCCWQPAILDAAFQSILPLVSTTEDRYFLPSGAGAVIGAVTLNTAAWVHARKKSEAVFDLAIADQDGDILVRIYDFTIREWHAAVQQQQEVPEGLCLLQPAWEEAPLATDTALTAKLLVFTTPGAPVNPALKQQYPPTYIRFVYPAYAGEDGAAHYTLRQQDGQQAYDELWDSLLQQGWQPDHIITDRSFSGTDHFLHWFRLSKSIVSKRPQRILLQYVYPAGDSREEPFAAAVHAFLKSVALECPAIRGSVVAYDQAALPAKYFAGEEGRVKYRHGVRYRQVLTAPDIKPVSLSSSGFRPDGVYIIIGGAGGIGLAMAKYLAASYKARLVLVGRSAADENTTAMITALDAAGGHASYHAADVSSIVHMKELVAYVQGKWGKINGIIHAAGVLRDALLINKQPEQAMAVLQSKINGVQVLHECMAGISFDFLLLCSSVVSLLGNTGQCDYAYANGYLDGFASWRNEEAIAGKCHGHTMVLNWPYWKNGGMQLDKGILEWMNAHLGWRPLEDNTALWCVEYALQSAVAQWAVFYGDVTRIRKALQPSENTGGPASREDHPAVSSQPPVAMTALLKQLFAAEIRLDESKVSMRETFENYGIDSVNAMNLTRALEQYTGALPKTLFYEYRTLTALQEYLLQEFPDAWPGSRPAEDIILPAGDTQVITSIPIVTQVSIVQQDIAIVGLAGQYPMADTLEAFWENLKAGKDCITEIPANRWDWQAYFDPERNKDGKSYSRWGGFLEDADKFDPLFFSISPREAKIMDPQERVFLQTVWHLLEDAGYSKKQLSGSNTGVFVGVMYGQYQLYGAAPDNQEQGVIPSSLHASVANRVSYFYDFTGPSIALDTMCSSSLTAIHLACNSLLNGDCNLAVAGGVNITTHPNKYLLLSQFNFASSDGRCRSFGDGGDGYVPGEGSGAVLLKPLQQALLDNDHIYGVIKGTAANHGGRSNGYTVPTPLAQASVIDKALQRANVDPQQISYVEAHGTGTALGDPVELAGLVKALRPDGKHANICSIGAVKSNIGHLESAAGIAGLTKVLLQLQHKQLAPSLHSNVLNTNLDFSTTPFYVQQQLQDWGTTVIPTPEGARELPRLAGLSSFGAGGANAHLIIAEYPQLPVTATGQPGEQLIVLSAFDEQSLRNVVSGLITYLEGNVVAVIPDHLEDTLKQLAALLLDISPEEIKPGIALDEYGFDTMITSIWLTKAGEKYGFDPAMYDYEGCSTLTDYARRMVGLYRLSTGETSGISLTSLGYTLLAGREPLPVRLALVTASIGQLTAQLKDYVATGTATRLWTGTAGRQEDAAWLEISQLARQGQWDLLAQRWVAGGDIDPALVFPAKRSRLKLPLYPFRKERYWVNEKPTPSPAAPTWKSGSVSKRHLISSNNPVIRDHVVSGQMILPAVAYLLIAIDTAEEYTGRRGWQPVRVNWLQPFTLTGSDSGDLHAVLTRSEEEIQFTIKDSSDKIYSTGSLVQTTAATYEIPSPHSGGQQLSAATAYKQLDGKGLAYGPYYRLIEQVSFNAQQVTGKLRLPETGMNAALLDAALQVVAAWVCAVEPAASLKVPYALSAFRWHQAPVGVAYIRAVSPLKNTYNIDMLNEDGQLCAQLQGLEVKELTGKKADWPLTYYQPVWEHRDLLSERTSPFDENTEAELLCVLPGAYSPVQASGLRRWFSRPLLTVTTGRTMREITPGHWELNATDIAEWTKILTEYEGIKSICWIAPYHTDAATADALGACEEAGILSFHALIKA